MGSLWIIMHTSSGSCELCRCSFLSEDFFWCRWGTLLLDMMLADTQTGMHLIWQDSKQFGMKSAMTLARRWEGNSGPLTVSMKCFGLLQSKIQEYDGMRVNALKIPSRHDSGSPQISLQDNSRGPSSTTDKDTSSQSYLEARRHGLRTRHGQQKPSHHPITNQKRNMMVCCKQRYTPAQKHTTFQGNHQQRNNGPETQRDGIGKRSGHCTLGKLVCTPCGVFAAQIEAAMK